jgi:hypothetical protein
MGRLFGVLARGVLALIVGACTTAPVPTPTLDPTDTAVPTPAASPRSPSPAPTPTLPVGPTPTPNANLHVGGMATVMRDGLRRWADPSTRDRGHYPRLAGGTLVYLADGPRSIDGVDYWQVWPSAWQEESLTSPLGWAPASRAGGRQLLQPYQPACPNHGEPLTASDTASLTELEQLSCFGASEIVVHGTVDCTRPIVDGFVGGAPYMDSNRSCQVGGFPVQGSGVYDLLDEPERVEKVSGFYEVRGHFDDPGAQRCHETHIGVSLELEGEPDPGAVMICRSHFVATSAPPAEGPDAAIVGEFEAGDLVMVFGGGVFGTREGPAADEPTGIWLYEGAGPYLADWGGFLGNYDFWHLWSENDLVGTFSDGEQADGGWLVPVAVDCPSVNATMDVATIIELTGLERIACFGAETISLRGSLRCFQEWAEPVVGGVPWIDDEKHCQLDDVLWLYGDPVTDLLRGDEREFRAGVVVEGHYDDPAARGCVMRALGSDPPPRFPGDPEAVIACRKMLVATSVKID